VASEMGKQRDNAPAPKERGTTKRPTRPRRAAERRRVHREALDVYLGELAASSPLTREQEVRIARRIEGAQSEAFTAVLESGVPLVELPAWFDAVMAQTLPVSTLNAAPKGEAPSDEVLVDRLREAVAHERDRSLAAAGLRKPGLTKARRRALEQEVQAAVLARNAALRELDLGRMHVDGMITRVADAMRAFAGAQERLRMAEKGLDDEIDPRDAQEAVDALLRQLERPPAEVANAWKVLAKSIRRADRAKAELTSANLRLVVSFAKRFVNRGVPLDDLIQEGNIGLMRAVEKFDHRVGTKFSTYASWWLRQAMQRAIVNQGRTVRLPVHVASSKSSTARVRQRLTGELGRTPELEELAERMGAKVEQVRQVLDASADSVPFDVPLGEESGLTLSEVLADLSAERPDEAVALDHRRERARAMLETLTQREQRILQMRFGIGSYEPHTLAEIGRHLGLTRERIRQIEMRALEKLRRVVERYVGTQQQP
jgi:RNA polymerase primary sigma factor